MLDRVLRRDVCKDGDNGVFVYDSTVEDGDGGSKLLSGADVTGVIGVLRGMSDGMDCESDGRFGRFFLFWLAFSVSPPFPDRLTNHRIEESVVLDCPVRYDENFQGRAPPKS